MKHMKKLLVFFIAIGLLGSCEKEETSYALQEVSAPSNLKSIFDISQDDTGTVTVTPTSVGATAYEIYFGDVADEIATISAPGESISHVYAEGEYTLRIVAIGLTGLTSELSRVVVISFTPPTDLTAEIDVTPTNPFEITVTPNANNVTVYDIYFGDVENEEPTTIMASEFVKHSYAEAGEYTVRIVARGAGSATIEITETVIITGASDPIVLPITFDNAAINYAFETFNGASFEVVDNPALTGANTEASKVGAITNSGANWEGGTFTLGTPVDFSGTNKTITMKFWSDVALPVLLKFEGGVNGERQNEVVATHGGTGWEELSFNFATDAVKSYIDGSQGVGEAFVPTGQYAKMVIFVDGPGTTAGTFYIDDIAKEAAATLPLELPITFDVSSVDYAFGTFNGAQYEVVDNPSLTGVNTVASKIGAIINSGGAYEGGAFNLDVPVDFSSSSKTITMKFWSNVEVPILLKFEGGVNGERQNEVVVTHGGTGWENLSFDFATNATKSYIDGSQGVGEAFVPTGQYATMVIFVDGPGNTAGTFYMDDIVLGSGGSTGGTGKTTFPVNFESPTGGASSLWNVFENVDNPALEIVSNPDASGENTSATVAKFTARQAGQPWAGTETPLQTPFTLSATNSTVKIKVWKSVISDVGIKFANGAGGSTGEIKVPNTKTNEWEELTFDFSGVIGDPNNTNIEFLVVFPDFNARTAETVSYFDAITLNAAGGSTGATAPTTAAPTPSVSAANVISMFSDAYTNVAVDTWRTDWSQANLEDVMIAGNATKKYGALDFVGIETTTTTIDASGMTHFHTDVWSADFDSFSIKLVDFGANGVYDGGGDDVEHQINITAPAKGQWVSLDIPLSDFTGLTTRGHIAQLIYVGTPTGANTVYVDNVYFHN